MQIRCWAKADVLNREKGRYKSIFELKNMQL